MVQTIPSFGDRKEFLEAIPFYALEAHVKVLKQAVFSVQIIGNKANEDPDDDWVAIGTGFFFKTPDQVILGITCKHIVDTLSHRGIPGFIGLLTDKGFIHSPFKVSYIAPDHDIAILAPQKMVEEEVNVQNLMFTEANFGTKSDIVEGRSVAIPGYPLGLGIKNGGSSPVIRIGIIAQYVGGNEFLIDGFASHGNSGSPVHVVKQNHRKLVGMVTSFKPDRINLYDETMQKAASFPYNSGIARAITIDVIKKAIKQAKY
jgi:S1-C subfamily serine protease